MRHSIYNLNHSFSYSQKLTIILEQASSGTSIVKSLWLPLAHSFFSVVGTSFSIILVAIKDRTMLAEVDGYRQGDG